MIRPGRADQASFNPVTQAFSPMKLDRSNTHLPPAPHGAFFAAFVFTTIALGQVAPENAGKEREEERRTNATAPQSTKIPTASQVTPARPKPAGDEPVDIVELSPFVINSSLDRGYESANTLSGTRLSTPTKYVGAASFEVTEALMRDLNLTNMQDLIDWTPNATSYAGGGITNDTTGNGAIFGVQYNVRGLVITSVSRDFMNMRAPDDAYSIEQFSFTRGPNSILFGIGQPGGIVNSISKRAKFANAYQFSTRFDTNGSHRLATDLNQVIVPSRVALRVAALTEIAMTHRKPSDRAADRLYGTLTVKPLAATTVRVSGEHGRIRALAVRPWIASDGTMDWVAKGRQEIPANLANGGVNYAQLAAAPAGSPSTAVNRAQVVALGFETQLNLPVPTFAYDNSGNGPPAIINSNGFMFTGRPTQPNGDRFQAWVDNPPIPYTTNILGYGNRLIQRLNNYTINIEQRIGDHLFVEATFNRQRTNNINDYSSGIDDNLYLDKNRTYLTWDGRIVTNPNYNRYFTYNGNSQGYLSNYIDQTARLMASYELDLRKEDRGLFRRILGHHNFAVMRERTMTDYRQDFFNLANTSPSLVSVPQFTAANVATPLSSNNRTNFINYITPGVSSTYADRGYWDEFPGFIYDGSSPPPPNANGITPAWTASFSNHSLQSINSQMAVAQNFFWDDRIVTTFGARNDVSELWSLPSAVNPVTNRVIDTIKRDVKSTPTGKLRYAGNTYTQGVVVTPFRWFGLFYNASQSFVPPNGIRVDLFGNPLPSGTGKGQDYGIKLNWFSGRVTGTIQRYTTKYAGVVTGLFRGGSTSLLPAEAAILTTMADTGLGGPGGTYWSGVFPWPAGNLPYSSLNDVQSKGYEISLTANPAPNWRITANLSHQVSSNTNFGGTEARWVKEVAHGYFNANPQYLTLRTGSGPQGTNETIAQRLQDMDNILVLAQSLNGKADARQPQYTANFVMGYDFVRGYLKDISVGATYQWRQKMIIGYPYVPGHIDLFQTSKPFYSDAFNNAGLWARYKFRVFEKRMSVQVNVNNVNNDDRVHPYTALDRGNGTPIYERYILGPGRSVAAQATLDF